MARIDISKVSVRTGTGYPPPHDGPCRERQNQPLGQAGGLTQYGVNLTRLRPGVWSSQRHWHSHEDEFVWVLEGEVVLSTDEGDEVLRAGDCAAFPAGIENGHHFRNESAADAVLLAVGTRSDEDACGYPDIDMVALAGSYANPGRTFAHRGGVPYSDAE